MPKRIERPVGSQSHLETTRHIDQRGKSSSASSKPEPRLRDFVAFLANPGPLPKAAEEHKLDYQAMRNNRTRAFRDELGSRVGTKLGPEYFSRFKEKYVNEWKGATPLHIAARYRDAAVLRELLVSKDAIAALNATDDSGRTVLDWAELRPASTKRDNTLKILRDNGALRGTQLPAQTQVDGHPRLSTGSPSPAPTSAQNRRAPTQSGYISRSSRDATKRASLRTVKTQMPSGVTGRAEGCEAGKVSKFEDVTMQRLLNDCKEAIAKKKRFHKRFENLRSEIQADIDLTPDVRNRLLKAYEDCAGILLDKDDATLHQCTTNEKLEGFLERLKSGNKHLDKNLKELNTFYETALLDQEFGGEPESIQRLRAPFRSDSSSSVQASGTPHLHAGQADIVGADSRVDVGASSRPPESEGAPKLPVAEQPTKIGNPLAPLTQDTSESVTDRRTQLIAACQDAINERAGYQADYEALKSEIEADSQLDAASRNTLLQSIQLRTTTLQDDHKHPIGGQTTAADQQEWLSSFKAENAMLKDGLEKFRGHREKLVPPGALVPSRLSTKLNPSDKAVPQPALRALQAENLDFLSKRISSDRTVPGEVRNVLERKVRTLQNNPFLQLDPQQISRFEDPEKKAWAAHNQTRFQLKLDEKTKEVLQQYESARSPRSTNPDHGKAACEKPTLLVNNDTQSQIESLRAELQPAAFVQKKTDQFFDEMSGLHGLSFKVLGSLLDNSARQHLPKIQAELAALAGTLNQRIVHRLPWKDIQKAIDASVNWLSLQRVSTRNASDELRLLRHKLAYQEHLDKTTKLLAEPQNEKLMREHRHTVERCAASLREVFESLDRLANAHLKLEELGRQSTVAKRAAELLLKTPENLNLIPRLDTIISTRLHVIAGLRPADAMETAIAELHTTCKKTSEHLRLTAHGAESLYTTLLNRT